MAVVLGIDASWDIATQYGEAFRNRFIFSDFTNKWPQHQLHRLIGPDAAQPHVDEFLTQYPVRYITGMGHGDYTIFFGHQNDAIWEEGHPLPPLQNTIIHLLSCKTGASLGRWLVTQGIKAFWGYTVEFVFSHQTSPPEDLATDPAAAVFFHMACIIDHGILSGKTAEEIYDSVTNYVARMRSKLSPARAAVLLNNYRHLVCPAVTWGASDAML